MSAEGVAAAETASPLTAGSRVSSRTRLILRFSVGTTIGSGFAYLIGFELPYLVPVLIAALLASPAPRPDLRTGIAFVGPIATAAVVGVFLTRYLLAYRLIFLLVEFLVLYRVYYGMAGGANKLRMVWLLIVALIVPLVGTDSITLSIGVAIGLVYGAAIAVGVTWFAHVLVADPPSPGGGPGNSPKGGKPVEPPPAAARARYARLNVIVVFPVLAAFFLLGLTSYALVLVYIALLSLLPNVAAGWKQGKAMINGNLIGGAGAIVFYNLLVAYPTITMFLLLTFLAALIFSDAIFSDRPAAPLFKTAFTAVLLLVGASLMATGADAASEFYSRIAQVITAVVYVAVAFGFLEYLQRKRVKKA